MNENDNAGENALQNPEKPRITDRFFKKTQKPKKADNVNVNVNDNKNENINENVSENDPLFES